MNTRLTLARERYHRESTGIARWSFFAVVSTGLLLVALDNSIQYTAVPALTEQLGARPHELLWIINAYPLMITGLLLGCGTLGDRIGHRRMFTAGLIIFGIASLAAAFSPTPLALVAARAALGIGAATMMPATLALIRLTFADERERNIALGLWASVALGGTAAGPVVGGALLELFWWGSVYLVNVPIVLMSLVALPLLAPPNIADPTRHWDALSSLYSLLALSGLTLGIKEAANADRNPVLLTAALAVSGAAAIAFTKRQRRLTQPLLTFDIFRSRIFNGGVLAASGAMVVLPGFELITSQKLQLADGQGPLYTGALIAIISLTALPMTALGGAYLHRIGFLPLISGGFLVMGLGLFTVLLNPENMTTWRGLLGLILIGIGSGASMSVASIAIIGSAPEHRSGMAAGVEEVSYEFGALLSIATVGSLLPSMYAARLPDEISHQGYALLNDPEIGAVASQALSSAYTDVSMVLASLALLMGALTGWCFRDNPRSSGTGRGH